VQKSAEKRSRSWQHLPAAGIRNLRVKLIALAMAFFLWFYVVTESTYQYELEIPIRVTNLAPDRMMLDELPPRALVRVEGSGKALIGLMVGRDVWLAADLSGVTRGKTWRPKVADVALGRWAGQIRVVEVVSPETLRVELDLVAEDRLPVKGQVEIRPAPGYTLLAGVETRPESVLVRGPRSVVRRMGGVSTVRRTYQDVRKDVLVDVPLDPPARVSVVPSRVRVIARVDKLMERTLVQLPVTVENVPPGTRGVAMPPEVSVTVRGAMSRVVELNPGAVRPFVDYSSPVPGSMSEYVVRVSAPPGIQVEKVEPTEIRVLLERLRR